MTNWIEWIKSNSMELNEKYFDELDLPDWFVGMVDEFKDMCIHDYWNECDRKAKLEWNWRCEETTIKYIGDNYDDIIHGVHGQQWDWTMLGNRCPVTDMGDILEVQKFVMSQYDREKLLSDPDSPYWDKTGLFLMCILSREFIAYSIEHGHGKRLSYESGFEERLDYNLVLDDARQTSAHLCMCPEDLEILDANIDDLLQSNDQDVGIIKLQAICRGRNARWRCPLYLLTIS